MVLYGVAFGLKFGMETICSNRFAALASSPTRQHAQITAPYVTEEGLSPSSDILRNSFSTYFAFLARESFEMRVLYRKVFALTPSLCDSSKSSTATLASSVVSLMHEINAP